MLGKILRLGCLATPEDGSGFLTLIHKGKARCKLCDRLITLKIAG